MDLTTILDDLIREFGEIPIRLTDVVIAFIPIFMMIEVVYQLGWREKYTNTLSVIKDNLKLYCWVSWVIINYTEIRDAMNSSVIWLANKATGMPTKDVSSLPSAILKNGYVELAKFWDMMTGLSFETIGYFLLWVLGIIILALFSIQIFLAYLEYALVVNIAIIFLPLSIWTKTSDWGNKVYPIIFSQNMKIFTLTVVTNFTVLYLNKVLNVTDFLSGISYVTSLAGLVYINYKVPEMIGGMFSGTPATGGASPATIGAVTGAMAGSLTGAVAGGVGGLQNGINNLKNKMWSNLKSGASNKGNTATDVLTNNTLQLPYNKE